MALAPYQRIANCVAQIELVLDQSSVDSINYLLMHLSVFLLSVIRKRLI